MCLTCLIGCTGNQDKGEDGSLDEEGNYRPSSDVAQVEFWINGDKYELDVFSSLADQFNEKYKGQIKVNLKQKPSDGYETAVETALTGNKLDLFYVGDAGYKAYAEQGLLYDITDFVENSKIYDLSKMWPNVITRYKYDVNTKLSGTESGRYYGVPKDIGPTVIYYNETEFEKAGIKIGDVIIEAEGNKITKMDEVNEIKNTKKIGDEMKIKVNRNGQEKDLTITLGEQP